jgi:hypothetical protein
VWGWVGIAEGHRAILQLIPDQSAAIALTTNSSRGRDLYRDLFPPLLADRFGIVMPPFNLARASGHHGGLDRYAGTYAWPDDEFVVVADGDRLQVTSSERSGAAFAVTERVFVLAPDDPDIPVVVFDDFDADGRPQILYSAVWGYPRVREVTRAS